MSFEDSPATSGSRYLGQGFRQEPDFRDRASGFGGGSSPSATSTTTTGIGVAVTDAETTVARRSPVTNLDYVFDDPADGEPGRDRMLVHLIWELVLLLALAGAGYLVYRQDSTLFSGAGLRTLLLFVSVSGLLAVAVGLTLRAGAPNLAVGACAVAGGLYYLHHPSVGVVPAILAVIGLAAAVGAVSGLVTVALHVPSWAVSIAVALGLLAWVDQLGPVAVSGRYDPTPHAYYWFGGFCAASVIAALVGLVPSVRRAFGRFRPVSDPAQRRGAVAGVIVVGVTMVSTMLAAVAGVLLVSLAPGRAATTDTLTLTALALGTALVGGTSAFGRRDGIFGTVLAVGLIAMVGQYLSGPNRSLSDAGLAAVLIGVGLVVTRLVERFGRPALGVDSTDDEDWVPAGHAASAITRSTWQPSTPAAPSSTSTTTTTAGLWASDDAWGSTEQR